LDEQPVHSDRDQFDEVAYLRLYPDIATAIAEGREPGAWEHHDRHGRKRVAKPTTSMLTFTSVRILRCSMRSPRASP
jgi:hypothetical protein